MEKGVWLGKLQEENYRRGGVETKARRDNRQMHLCNAAEDNIKINNFGRVCSIRFPYARQDGFIRPISISHIPLKTPKLQAYQKCRKVWGMGMVMGVGNKPGCYTLLHGNPRSPDSGLRPLNLGSSGGALRSWWGFHGFSRFYRHMIHGPRAQQCFFIFLSLYFTFTTGFAYHCFP